MANLLKLALNNFWSFCGTIVLVTMVFVPLLDFMLKMVNRILRHRNILKHGYPPEHCDADGDFLPDATKVYRYK